MALKTCPHCGHSVSDKATKCPQCGKDPRFTYFQLEQQDQQRKKKRKKTIIISASVLVAALAVFCIVFLPHIADHSRQISAYNDAQALFKSWKYTQAAEAFDALGDFEDSAQRALESRYQYVSTHQSRTDPTTLKYVEYLMEKNYSNIKALSRSIYEWKCKAYVTNEENGSPIAKTYGPDSPLYFMFQAYGGKPNEKISVKYQITYHASIYAIKHGYTGKTKYDTISYKLSDGGHFWYGWATGIGTSLYDQISITFYNADTNEVLATTKVSIQP